MPPRKWNHYDGATGWSTVGTKRTASAAKSATTSDHARAFVIPNVKRDPAWKCPACSFGENWRGRTQCVRCGKQAAAAHIAEVMLESTGRQALVAGAPACSATLAGSIPDLAAALKAKQAVLDAAKKAGSGEAAIALLSADLEATRAEFQAAKPVTTQLKQAEARHTAAVKELYSHREKVAAHKKIVEEAVAATAALEALEPTVQARIKEAMDTVDELRRQVAQGAAEDGVTRDEDPFAGMPKAWRLFLEARPDKSELLAGFAATAPLRTPPPASQPAPQEAAEGSANAAAGSQDMEAEFDLPAFLTEFVGDELADGLDPLAADAIKQCKLHMAKRPDECRAALAKRRRY
jgi:hypothetical protein